MDYEAGDLRIEGNNYYVQSKRKFVEYAKMDLYDTKKCFDFAYDMSYGNAGEHRDHRNGGIAHRENGQIFVNTFQGKMAEYAVYRYLKSKNIQVELPDLETYSLGQWDLFDLECKNKHISVKSTKSFGQLLLLEERDWNWNGEYVPNLQSGTDKYDYTILVRFQPNAEALMKKNGLLNQRDEEISGNIKNLLWECFGNQEWGYDFAGFIFYSELVKMIRQNRIIPQNALVNGKTKMDATNYYFQAGNMHALFELYTRDVQQKRDEREEDRLERTCPWCGRKLILRKGYSWFWGCEGYSQIPKCTYTCQMD